MPIHHGMTEAEYNALPGLRSSTVRAVMQNPARYKHQLDNPSTEKHFTIGSAVHDLVLGDGSLVVHVPVNDWKTVKAREQRDAALAAGKYPLNNAEHVQALAMAESLRTQPTVAKHLAAGHTEVVIEGVDPVTWTPMKARLDILDVDARVIVDPKTSATMEPGEFGTHAWRHGYHIAAAHYIEMAAQATGTDPEEWTFLFAVVEKTAPYLPFVTELDPESLDIGRRDRARGIATYLECERTQKWPGYSTEVMTTRLPKWAFDLA
jgi:hypothetical protein